MWLIFNPVTQCLVGILLLFGVGLTIWGLSEANIAKIVSGGVLFIVSGIMVWVIGTTVVVPPNTVAVIVNETTGQPDSRMRTPGFQNVPFWGRQIHMFPFRTDFQWCPDFTPSVKGGAGVTVKICYTIDTKGLDWVSQYARFNGNLDVVTAAWQRALTQGTANAISEYNPRDLTDNRDAVVTSIRAENQEVYKNLGWNPDNINLDNWRFTSEALNQAYDEALLSQTQVDKASFEQQAVQIQQETDRIKADTQILVAETLAEGHVRACATAGMTTAADCLEYLQILWLMSNDTDTVVVSVGGGDTPNVSVPIPTPVVP